LSVLCWRCETHPYEALYVVKTAYIPLRNRGVCNPR
jgi:hypothetical protein